MNRTPDEPGSLSISNFPVSARPQTGLSTSPLVFEMYIGEGMTRFLALFYGEYAKGKTTAAEEAAAASEIGPIRSGRLPYEDVRTLYDGFLVMSGAYISVAQQLNAETCVYNRNPEDINGTGISLANLQTMAEQYRTIHPNEPAIQGMRFAGAVPTGGEEAQRLWMFYNYYNQAEWTYDSASGKYLRAQDKADGSGVFYPSTDKLTGEQLGFENVVVLFAPHEFKAPTLVDIDLLCSSGTVKATRPSGARERRSSLFSSWTKPAASSPLNLGRPGSRWSVWSHPPPKPPPANGRSASTTQNRDFSPPCRLT